MSQVKPNTYTPEFRASGVKLANESDKPVSSYFDNYRKSLTRSATSPLNTL